MNLKSLIKLIVPPLLFLALKRTNYFCSSLFGNRLVYRKLCAFVSANPEMQELFPKEELVTHYAYEPMRQTVRNPDLMITQIRYYRMYKYFHENYPDIFDKSVPVIDVGDTSGILFRAMKRKGLSVNINRETVEFIRKKGIEAQMGDAEKLPFKDKTFDYAFCFQCLEHLPNPIRALQELDRVTRKKVFLSIPYSVDTVIYDLDYYNDLKKIDIEKGGWGESCAKDVDCHIFEFSTKDFKNILSHTRLKYRDNFPINYFRPLGATYKNEGSYFNFFILEPV